MIKQYKEVSFEKMSLIHELHTLSKEWKKTKFRKDPMWILWVLHLENKCGCERKDRVKKRVDDYYFMDCPIWMWISFFFGFEGERACMRGNCVKNYGNIAQIGHEFLFKGGPEGECGWTTRKIWCSSLDYFTMEPYKWIKFTII